VQLVEFPVVKEGLLLALPLCILTIFLAFFVPLYVTILLVFLNLSVLCFFRNPRRTTPSLEGSVIAPADGKVVHIGKYIEDQFLGEEVLKISIFMSVFNVHINRIPTSGRISDVLYRKGSFFSANLNKASLMNEQNALFLETGDNKRILFIQIAGLIARRIVCWIKKGDDVTRGQRFGLICFGSRMDVFLPLNTSIDVEIGQKVRGGETILGYLS